MLADSPTDWSTPIPDHPDIVILMTDEERAIPPYESPDALAWHDRTLKARKWFDEHGVSF